MWTSQSKDATAKKAGDQPLSTASDRPRASIAKENKKNVGLVDYKGYHAHGMAWHDTEERLLLNGCSSPFPFLTLGPRVVATAILVYWLIVVNGTVPTVNYCWC